MLQSFRSLNSVRVFVSPFREEITSFPDLSLIHPQRLQPHMLHSTALLTRASLLGRSSHQHRRRESERKKEGKEIRDEVSGESCDCGQRNDLQTRHTHTHVQNGKTTITRSFQQTDNRMITRTTTALSRK